LYRDFVRDGLRHGVDDPFDQVKNRLILGDESFVLRVKDHIRAGSRREQPAYRDLVVTSIAPDVAVAIIADVFHIKPTVLSQRGGSGVVRGIAAELMYRYCDLTQAQIGAILGEVDYMAVNQLRRRVRTKLVLNPAVRKLFDRAETELTKVLL
jgi:hypothetical protein